MPFKSRTKYRAVRTDGFSSKREAKRAKELMLLERAGEISDLRYQVPYVLIPKQDGERECKYVCDFEYTDKYGNKVTEDVKGYETPEWVIKRKLMQWVHGIKVKVTK